MSRLKDFRFAVFLSMTLLFTPGAASFRYGTPHLQARASRGTLAGVTIDYVAYPLDSHPGNPWSQWGKGLAASNGKVYSSIGDHGPSETLSIDGNGYVYEYDPETRVIRCIFDVQSNVASYAPGDYGWGKVHGRINEGADGNLYFGTYWGRAGDHPDYLGDHIFKLDPHTGLVTDLGTVSRGTADFGFPSTNMYGKGMVWYAEALDKHSYVYSFLAFDVVNRQVKLLGAHPSGYGRRFFVDAQGNAYFNDDANGLTKYASNSITTTYLGLPGSQVRQVTTPRSNGVMYGTLTDTYRLFSFNPATEAFQTLATLPADTAAMDIDPTGNYIYYIPGTHSVCGNATLYQYSISTGATRTIVNLKSFLESNLGQPLGGSYNLSVSHITASTWGRSVEDSTTRLSWPYTFPDKALVRTPEGGLAYELENLFSLPGAFDLRANALWSDRTPGTRRPCT